MSNTTPARFTDYPYDQASYERLLWEKVVIAVSASSNVTSMKATTKWADDAVQEWRKRFSPK